VLGLQLVLLLAVFGGGFVGASTPVAVELDVFSGRPNPTWQLTGAEAAELRSRLADPTRTPLASATVPPPSGRLGYRGFVLGDPERTLAGADRLEVGEGFVRAVHGATGRTLAVFADADRALERWLVAAARSRAEPGLLPD
jgi:hypothetical protein